MSDLKLYMALLGCKPKGRLTEQHDVFFGIGRSLAELVPLMHKAWPEAKRNLHIDGWREVSSVNGHRIKIVSPHEPPVQASSKKLFFLNLGGYKKDELEEYHYKMLAVSENMSDAIQLAKQESFFKHTGFKGAPAHVDEKYGIAVDEAMAVEDCLPEVFREQYKLVVLEEEKEPDIIHLGYLQLWKIKA